MSTDFLGQRVMLDPDALRCSPRHFHRHDQGDAAASSPLCSRQGNLSR